MRILALEPYYGGSHKAFLDSWIEKSRHEWDLYTLPDNKWKWRMRHGAITLADRIQDIADHSRDWDLLFCSDMLNLAEFRGLTQGFLKHLPSVVYFHENQVTYPVERESEFDFHFAFSNLSTALAAHQVWFNSSFHRDSFLSGMEAFLRRMPDHVPLDALPRILQKSAVHYPGIHPLSFPRRFDDGPLRILWCARWEFDKGPERFFEALKVLQCEQIDFEVSIIGGWLGRTTHPVFEKMHEHLHDHISHWGYQETREAYENVLAEADVIVSTADHEFFGLSVVEAIAAGVRPLLPNRLAYPEVLDQLGVSSPTDYLYDGSLEELVHRLRELARRKQTSGPLCDAGFRTTAAECFNWEQRVPQMDTAMEAATGSS